MLPVLKAPSSKQNRKQHTQHSKHTRIRNQRQHKPEIKMLKQKHNHFYNSINITALIKNNLVIH